MTRPDSGVNIKGTISKFKLNDNDLNSLIERFELYVLHNEIYVYMKLSFLIFLANERLSLILDLCTPSKPVDSSYVVSC